MSDVTELERTRLLCSALVIAVNQHCLEKVLRMGRPDLACIGRLLLSLIFQASKDDNHTRAIEALNAAFTGM